MANEEHFKVLLKGAEAWNQWRESNPEIEPDLSNANLIGVSLRRANLSEADLNGANLSQANLVESYFGGASLKGTDLSHTNLRNANLRGAVLTHAKLSGAVFDNADLVGANLDGSNLSGASLKSASLEGVELSEADLREADLEGAHLRNANLIGANLSRANLIGADLRRADLSGADISLGLLNNADLREATLRVTRLIYATLENANLTGTCLWETQRAGWSIKRIVCDYVYWDNQRKEKTEYTPGEFERLFADQTKIKLFFKDGISPLEIATLPALIQHLEDMQDCSLRFVSITESAGGAVVELAIENTDNQSVEEIKQLQSQLQVTANQAVEFERRFLAGEKQKLQLEGRLEELRLWFREQQLLLASTSQFTIQGNIHMSDKKGDTYNISGQVGAVGPNARAEHNTFNQIWNQSKDSIDLVALATELATLRIAIAKLQDPSPQAAIAAGEIARAEIAAGEKDESKVYRHLKAAGNWAFDTATKIGTSVAAEVIKKSMGL